MEETKKNIKEDIKKVLESKIAIKVLYGIGVVIIAMLIFKAGIIIGFQKASFGKAWGEHYNENFGMGHHIERNIGPVGGMMDKVGMMDYFPNAHGATGRIIKIESPNIIVQDKTNTEKVIAVNTGTTIEIGREEMKIADLKIDDFIVVVGTPNEQGQIEAKLIRVIPAPQFLKQ